MAKKIYLDDVDNRVDTTRRGYLPSTIPYGAGNTFVGANPLDAILSVGDATDPRNDNYNPYLITGTAPNVSRNLSNIKSIYIKNRINKLGHKPYKSISRLENGDAPVRSSPIVDFFRLQLPSFKTGELGRGHYYRAIGGKKGLQDAIKNGFRGKHPEYQKYGHTYWAKDEPLREYTKDGPLMVSYDKTGPYKFGKGNFDNPISGNGDIKFTDKNVRLYGRYPFSSKYHEIPKTKEGIKHANTLSNLNKYIETPIRLGVKGYLGYKAFDWYKNNLQNNKKK